MTLPEPFLKRMEQMLGDEMASFLAAIESPAPVSVRVNPGKLKNRPAYEQVPWCDTGYFLPSRPNFASDPLWHAGAYYVQESSSMLLGSVFTQAVSGLGGPLKILDLCAAPGGKSTHIASLMSAGDILVSNEVIRGRTGVLLENIRKHGNPGVLVTNADSSDFERLGPVFDIIVADVPCSGEGLFRKDHQASAEWSEDNIRTCELRQRRILRSAAQALKTGGYLIYSTCTWNPGENEEQTEFLCASGFEAVPFQVNGKLCTSFRAYPHLFRGEGFFIALLRKTAEDDSGHKRIPGNIVLKPASDPENFTRGELEYREYSGNLLAAPPGLFRFLTEELGGIRCIAAGSEAGILDGKRFTPSPYLPFSTIFNRDSMAELKVDHETALLYLSRQSVRQPENNSGYVYPSFAGIPLGLGKFAGNRINNLYPKEWLLRKIPTKNEWFCLTGI